MDGTIYHICDVDESTGQVKPAVLCGKWLQNCEGYIARSAVAEFTLPICPACLSELNAKEDAECDQAQPNLADLGEFCVSDWANDTVDALEEFVVAVMSRESGRGNANYSDKREALLRVLMGSEQP